MRPTAGLSYDAVIDVQESALEDRRIEVMIADIGAASIHFIAIERGWIALCMFLSRAGLPTRASLDRRAIKFTPNMTAMALTLRFYSGCHRTSVICSKLV
ncbi:hypothetical protein HY970_01210 [Candidatus Kaiserbacteria bacterium]|nr:hypothetical protein [Candidatus Kaiserbacteria bacterium]